MVRAHADGAAPSMLFPAAFSSLYLSLSPHTPNGTLPGVWRVARQITILQFLDKTTPMQLLYCLASFPTIGLNGPPYASTRNGK